MIFNHLTLLNKLIKILGNQNDVKRPRDKQEVMFYCGNCQNAHIRTDLSASTKKGGSIFEKALGRLLKMVLNWLLVHQKYICYVIRKV